MGIILIIVNLMTSINYSCRLLNRTLFQRSKCTNKIYQLYTTIRILMQENKKNFDS
jgi:hypothetical protein